MKSAKTQSKLLIACIALVSVLALLKASYYKSDFFPIGLTGLNYTGYDPSGNNCPYGNVDVDPRWSWDGDTNSEKALIEALGVNCIGCEDAYHYYLNSWSDTSANRYLTRVCNDSVLLITATYYTTIRFTDYNHDTIINGNPTKDTVPYEASGPSHTRTSTYWRTPYRGQCGKYPDSVVTVYARGGDPKFGNDCSINGGDGYNPFGITYDNWDDYDGDSIWHISADEAVARFDTFFTNYGSLADRIWGCNLISEDGGMYRYSSGSPPWHGSWAAVDRVFNGDNTEFPIPESAQADHEGFRGEIDWNSLGGHRMIVAKGGIWPLKKAGYNIFASLPDIDVIFQYGETMCPGDRNYGDQYIFDNLIYGTDPYYGFHNSAIYMQANGGTNLAYPDQKRRWIYAICLKWKGINASETRAEVRRPCPPEIRCYVYLLLSRGAKGIFFNTWLNHYGNETPEPDNIEVPASGSGDLTIGMRDYDGWPYGHPDAPSQNKSFHKLNDGTVPAGADTTYWHEHNDDVTYNYLALSLIPELKAIGPTLVQLNWDSAFSLASTVDTLAKPCPHLYVDSVITTGEGFIDLGFFEPSDWRDYGKYLMVVNRDGIADTNTATITLYLDFLEGDTLDSLYVIEFGDPNTDSFLPRASDGYFHLAEDYAPGEGKLFRFYPTKSRIRRQTPVDALG